MKELIIIVRERLDYLIRIKETINVNLASAPKGTLQLRMMRGRIRYYFQKGKVRRYINSEEKVLLEQLAQKLYLEEAQAAIDNEISVLSKLDSHLPIRRVENVYDELRPELRKFAAPLFPSDAEFAARWLSEKYDKLEGYNGPVYSTTKGDMVRSKSEYIIAEMLYKYGIPYKYERPLYIQGKWIRPDFTILNVAERKELIWEHEGLMDDMEYRNRAIEKNRAYNYSGYFEGDNLIVTFETSTHTLDTDHVELIIRKVILKEGK